MRQALGRRHERDPFRTRPPLPRRRPPQRIGYLRVSTIDQSTDRQADGLQDLCDALHLEQVSAVGRRPVFDGVIADLREGDTLLVWDLDRAFRSTLDAIMTADLLRQRGVALQIVQLSIDTGTPEGEFFYTIVAACAQFERRILSRRTKEGMEAARRRGVPIGRPPAIDPQTVRAAHTWMAETGLPCRYVAALLGVSRVTLQRAFRREGLVYPLDRIPTAEGR
ncbi:MAG: recombinase family protein [Pseudomonadota bacterium]